jgi:hypothetical protein
MKFRCQRCGAQTDNTVTMSRHVVEEHDRLEFGWSIIRVPETRIERPVTWLSNLPVQIRARYGSRLR